MNLMKNGTEIDNEQAEQLAFTNKLEAVYIQPETAESMFGDIEPITGFALGQRIIDIEAGKAYQISDGEETINV